MDRESTTQAVNRASDGLLCTICAVLMDASDDTFLLRSDEYDADEQRLRRKDDVVDKGSRASKERFNRDLALNSCD